jgi:NAD(P)H-flavin reductase
LGIEKGSFSLKYDKDSPEVVKTFENVGIIVGGTGVTPSFQIIKNACSNQDDKTKFEMIFSNHVKIDFLVYFFKIF